MPLLRKSTLKANFQKKCCSAHRGVKKKGNIQVLFQNLRSIQVWLSKTKSACFPSLLATLVPRGALVKAWHHSPWSGDHRQVALCSFAVINVTDGAWQWSLISAHSPTHLNQLHRKQRPPVLEMWWWAVLRSTKFSEGSIKAGSWRNNADLHVFPLRRALEFANGSSPPRFWRNSSSSFNPFPCDIWDQSASSDEEPLWELYRR